MSINRMIPLYVSLIVLLTTSCQNDSISLTCEGENVQFLTTFYDNEFEVISCVIKSLEEDKTEINLMITNEIDFEKYFTCSDQPPRIDFDKYFVLAGSYRHHQCARFDSQSVLVCHNKITYNVNMIEQDCQAFTNVYYVAVINNEYESYPIEFDVQFTDL